MPQAVPHLQQEGVPALALQQPDQVSAQPQAQVQLAERQALPAEPARAGGRAGSYEKAAVLWCPHLLRAACLLLQLILLARVLSLPTLARCSPCPHSQYTGGCIPDRKARTAGPAQIKLRLTVGPAALR